MKNLKEEMIMVVFAYLLKQNTTTTTLDVKNYLRVVFPNEDWMQNIISEVLNKRHTEVENCGFSIQGTYRIYSVKPKNVEVSMTKLAEMVVTSKNQVTVTFYKKDNSVRTITGTPSEFDALGYLMFYENNVLKRVNLRKLISATINNINYIVK